MTAAQLILTIAPDRAGKVAMWVSLRGADGTPAGPAREIVLDNRLAGFVADMQALARAKLAALKASAERRPGDRDPAIAVDAAHGEHGR